MWLRFGGKDWMNPLDREARLKPAVKGTLPRAGGHGLKPVSTKGAPAEARQRRGGDASVTLGLTGKKPASAYATEIEPHQMEGANL